MFQPKSIVTGKLLDVTPRAHETKTIFGVIKQKYLVNCEDK